MVIQSCRRAHDHLPSAIPGAASPSSRSRAEQRKAIYLSHGSFAKFNQNGSFGLREFLVDSGNNSYKADTAFPIIFATMAGRAGMKHAAFTLERGAALEKLEQLVGSRTLGSTITTQ